MKEKTEKQEEVLYTIESTEVAGNPVKRVLDKNGVELFVLSEDFSESQIAQVFKLCSQYYQRGGQQGFAQSQAQIQAAIGINQQTIVDIARAVLKEKE